MKHIHAVIFLFAHLSLAAFEPPPDTIKTSSDKELLARALVEELRQGLIELRVAEKEKSPEKKFDACLQLGNLYRREQLPARALHWFQQAESLAKNAGKEDNWLAAQTLVAETLLDNGQAQKAYDAWLQVLEKHEKANRYHSTVQALQKLADACLALRQFSKASDYYLKIKTLAQKQGDVSNVLTALNNLGFAASQSKDHAAAARYFSQADSLSTAAGLCTPGYVYTNLGIALHNLGEDTNPVIKILELASVEETDKSYVQHLIATIHLKNQDVYGALRYNEMALKSAARSKNAQVLRDAYDVASQVYQQLFEYDKAFDFYKKYLSLRDSLLLVERLEKQDLENLQALLEDREHDISQNLKDQEIEALAIEQLSLEKRTLQLENDKQAIEKDRKEKEIDLLKKEARLQDAELRTKELEAATKTAALNLAKQELLAERRKGEIAELHNFHRLDSLDNARKTAVQQAEISRLEKDKEIQDLQLEKQQQFEQNAYRLGALLAAILLLIFGSWLYARRLNKRLASQNRQIASQKEEIDAERARAENLLLNILPTKVAQELKSTGTAKPQHYDSVTVLFTDFQGFTKIASTMPPAQVVQELNECFLAFDEIVEKHGLEKIKTMGDSYMCAGGLPAPNQTHPHDAVAAAVEMLAFIQNRNHQNATQGKPEWQIRIGVHTGEVVAGVVGSKKFAYDIWGDTVNVASRMESNCLPGYVNLSEATYQLVSQRFSGNYRGEVEVKNKGKMGMYLVSNSNGER